ARASLLGSNRCRSGRSDSTVRGRKLSRLHGIACYPDAHMADVRRFFDEIPIGEESVSPGRTVTEADIVLFAGLSGDYNILHTDAEYMKSSLSGERIAHGLLGLAIQSGLFTRAGIPYATLGFGTLRWKFKGPIKIGDTIRVRAKATH